MNPLPISSMGCLLKKAGAKRVAESAKSELKEILGRRIVEIGKRAALFSKHAGRKTIKKIDIELALKP